MAGLLFDDVREPPPPRMTAEQWAPRVRVLWSPGLSGALAMGRELAAAKQLLPHGEFGRLFRGHRDAVVDPLPFSWRVGQRLMALARHRVLADAAHAPHLPASWATLVELAKLKPERVQAGIAAGWIHAGMQRRDVGGPVPVVVRERPTGEQVADDLSARLSAALELLSRSEVEYVGWRLEGMARGVRRQLEHEGKGGER